MKRRNFIKTTTMATTILGFPTIVPSSVFGKNAPSNKINIGQIGCGRIAREHDLPGTWQHDSARIVAVSDVDSKRMKEGKELVEKYYTQKNWITLFECQAICGLP
jgi:myo-inositol 2-dehydrogenase/D-chiro-inositol 1-dehydrogenase